MQKESTVHEKLTDEILSFWFEGTIEQQFQRWFSSGDARSELDRLIGEKYGPLLSDAEMGAQFEFDPYWCDGARAFVAKIILHDQFGRHIYRDQSVEANRVRLAQCDKRALAWAHQLVSDANPNGDAATNAAGVSREALFRLPLGQFVFALMPFRHSKLERNLKLVLELLEERERMHGEDGKLLDRFKKTTIRKLYDAEDEDGAGRALSKEETVILEHFPFDADESAIDEERLYLCMQEFLERKWRKEMKYTVVSLSGGVDSMVISKILCLLRPVFGFQVIAVHIDYANRAESGLEADYVEQWCAKLNMVYRKRRIGEVTRGITNREVYEKESRRIRFEFYESVLTEFDCHGSGIMLGHHKGDEQENLISNIFKGRESILNLTGMYEEGEINNVKIWRPFLRYTKKYIFDFAHQYGVPYFLDTTPKWSNRGKLRNELQPMMKDLFGAGYLNNLSALGEDSHEISELCAKYIFQPFWNTIFKSEVGIWVDVSNHREESKLFWKETLRHMFFNMGTSTIRDKAMYHFLKRLYLGTTEEQGVWVSLKKENLSLLITIPSSASHPVHTNITSEHSANPHTALMGGDARMYLVIFREKFFGPYGEEKIDYWPPKSQALKVLEGEYHWINQNTNAQWKVNLAVCPKSEFHRVELTLWDILNGKLVYYLPGSDSYCVDSNSRIKPFRLINSVISNEIPVVVVQKESEKKDEDIDVCLRVTLTWINDEYEKEKIVLKKMAEKEAMLRAEKEFMRSRLTQRGHEDDEGNHSKDKKASSLLPINEKNANRRKKKKKEKKEKRELAKLNENTEATNAATHTGGAENQGEETDDICELPF